MLRILCTTVLCILLATSTYAQTSSLTISDPQRWAKSTQGIITDAEIDITPEGAYAKVDLTFLINAENTYKSTDTLEAVLNFSLPKGSYINDSWLWLDQNTIIKADIIERNRAITIYEGIVNRRRDPSLLVKTGTDRYKLNVFPLTTLYPRKVKISYAVPLNWQGDMSKLPLPTDLFRVSKTAPTLTVKVNTNPLFRNPSFVINDYSQHYISTVGGQDLLQIPGTSYAQNDFTLKYNTQLANSISVITYPTGNNEGYYQMIIPPSVIDKTSTRCVSLIVDYDSKTQAIHTPSELKQKLTNAFLSNYNTTDSFNLFYVNNGQIVQAFTSWQSVSNANLNQAFNNMPNSIATTSNTYESLLKTGMQFCAGKTKDEAEVLLIGTNADYTIDQQKTNTLFSNIKTALGSYNHKINVINNNRYRQYKSGSGYYYANEILYSKLTLATGGLYFRNYSYKYILVNNKYQVFYDIDFTANINQISSNAGISTSAYNITLKPITGFVYNEYTMFKNQKLHLSDNYIVLGKYKGNLTTGSTVDIQAVTNTKTINKTVTINTITPGTKGIIQDWANLYIQDLESYNNASYTQEIIDSSINNRVLCYKTAFLAIETGDTLKSNIDDNPDVVSVKNTTKKGGTTIKAYPNPFNNEITIELPANATQIEIYDVLGRKVFVIALSKNDKKYVWNGRNSNGDALSAGTYVIIVKTEDSNQTLKVLKQ
ncbi:MAG: T9SS type A sorting domain-containing protein [Flavipsychrobacter sp.]